MKLDAQNFMVFKSLVEADDKQTEVRCGEYLEPATDILLRQTPLKIITLKKEQWNYFGRSDYMIVADLRSEVGGTERIIEMWELKAPQAPLMEYDEGMDRYRPSKELVKAETQLFHYAYEARLNGNLHRVHDIRYHEKIRGAGIIIGRDGRYVKNGTPEQQDQAKHSFEIRNNAVYRPLNIRIVTWDFILGYVDPGP